MNAARADPRRSIEPIESWPSPRAGACSSSPSAPRRVARAPPPRRPRTSTALPAYLHRVARAPPTLRLAADLAHGASEADPRQARPARRPGLPGRRLVDARARQRRLQDLEDHDRRRGVVGVAGGALRALAREPPVARQRPRRWVDGPGRRRGSGDVQEGRRPRRGAAPRREPRRPAPKSGQVLRGRHALRPAQARQRHADPRRRARRGPRGQDRSPT